MNKFNLLFFLIGLVGCNYNRVKEAASSPSAGKLSASQLDRAADLNYASIQKKVLEKRCLGCHSNGGGNKGGLNLESYDGIKAKLNQISYRSIEVKDMPVGGLPPDELALFQAWLESGAPLMNTGRGAGVEIKGAMNWPRVTKLILSSSCLDCHVKPNPDGQLDLSNFQNFKDHQVQIYQRVFVLQDMPPKPYPSLGVNEKTALLKWISQGLPQ